jgi:hypothetical protein
MVILIVLIVFEEKIEFEGQMGKIGILRILAANMDFSCF